MLGIEICLLEWLLLDAGGFEVGGVNGAEVLLLILLWLFIASSLATYSNTAFLTDGRVGGWSSLRMKRRGRGRGKADIGAHELGVTMEHGVIVRNSNTFSSMYRTLISRRMCHLRGHGGNGGGGEGWVAFLIGRVV